MAITNKIQALEYGLNGEIAMYEDYISDTLRFFDKKHNVGFSASREFIERTPVGDLVQWAKQRHTQSDDYINPGLSNRQLRDPVIRQAWNEIQLMIRLKGLEYEQYRN